MAYDAVVNLFLIRKTWRRCNSYGREGWKRRHRLFVIFFCEFLCFQLAILKIQLTIFKML